MSIAIRISDKLAQKARRRSKTMHRSLANQIEYWAQMGQLAEDNPDLPAAFIQDILIGQEQANAGELKPYPLKK